MKSHIVIFGMGDMGSALASLLRKNRHAVDAWDKSPGRVSNQKSLFEIIPRAEIIFLCVPSWCLPSVTRSIRSFVHKNTIIVGLSKGLQDDNKKTAYEFLSGTFPENPVLILGGAMLANELQKGMPGFGVLAGKNASVRERVAELFHGSPLTLTTSTDVVGVALSGVLKNIYAIGLGMAKGLDWGDNARAWFVFEAMHEMEAVVKLSGGKKESVYGVAGMIDLIATGFSAYSKNVEVGMMIVKNKKGIPQAEGVISLEPLSKILKSDLNKFPLLRAIYRTATHKEDPLLAFKRLLK